MCGIVGYVGSRSAQDTVIDGLRRLEYRGYDSAGVALVIGIGNPELKVGDMVFNGIALGTIAALVVFHVMTFVEKRRQTV